MADMKPRLADSDGELPGWVESVSALRRRRAKTPTGQATAWDANLSGAWGPSDRDRRPDIGALANRRSKLRLRQAFFLSWIDDIQSGSGRTSVWIASTIPLTVVYASNQRPPINKAWLEAPMAAANSPNGLQLVTAGAPAGYERRRSVARCARALGGRTASSWPRVP